jgi:hypothetical protein
MTDPVQACRTWTSTCRLLVFILHGLFQLASWRPPVALIAVNGIRGKARAVQASAAIFGNCH